MTLLDQNVPDQTTELAKPMPAAPRRISLAVLSNSPAAETVHNAPSPADVRLPTSAFSSSTPDPSSPLSSDPIVDRKLVEGEVIGMLRSIYDPELPINIYDLGLIYEVAVDSEHNVRVQMTLTAPACPVAGSLPGEVERRIETLACVKSARVDLVWDPPWSRERMSEAAQLQLGMF